MARRQSILLFSLFFAIVLLENPNGLALIKIIALITKQVNNTIRKMQKRKTHKHVCVK